MAAQTAICAAMPGRFRPKVLQAATRAWYPASRMSGPMKTTPTSKGRGHSSKSSNRQTKTPKEKVTAAEQREALKLAKALAGKDYGESLTDDDGPSARVYRKPAIAPPPEPIPGCVRNVPPPRLTPGDRRQGWVDLTPLGLQTLREQAAVDRSKAVIAYVLGVSKSMLETILQTNEQAKEAYELGKGMFEDRFTDALMTMADQGNVAAAIWVEKTRMGKRDNAPVSDGTRHVHIHLPDSVSPAEYMASLAQVHADSHRQIVDQAKEPERALPQPAMPWLHATGEAMPDPTDLELQQQIADALAPAPAQPLPVPVPIPPESQNQPEVAVRSRVAKVSSVDR